MKLTIALKLSLSAALLVITSAGIVGGLFYNKMAELLVTKIEENIAAQIVNAGAHFQERISTQHDDTLLLSLMPPIQGLIRASNKNHYDKLGKSTHQQWRGRLQSIFSIMLKNKPAYTTIRLIDKNGQEIVAVNRDNGKLTALKGKQLQNKSRRAYVQNTLKLPPGTVHLSEINLNREHGKISYPHQEVLRSATPVYDERQGTLSALLVINAEIGHVFQELQNNITNENNQIYITNDNGGYLLHPEPNKAYGFDLGRHYRIQEDIPKLATLYLPHNQDSHTVLLPEDTDGQNIINFTKIAFDPNRPDRFIAVGITELYNNILAQQTSVLNNILVAAMLMIFGVIMFAALFSYRLARPIKQITQVIDDYSHQRKTTATMPTHLTDEIGVLARSYQATIQQVDEAQRGLKELNQNLEASESRQRSIVDSMVDGLITINDKGQIASFNPAAEKIFGYRKKDVIGKNINMLMPDPYKSEHDGYLTNYQTTRIKKIIGIGREVIGLRKNGESFPMELGISETSADGQTIFTGVVRDISERKQIETMKSEFVSTVSHELRTPLTAIRGSLGLVNAGVMGELPEKANNLLQIASNNTERLLLLINDILDMQKIESGQMDFDFQDINLRNLLEQATENNTAYGDQYNIKFVIDGELPNLHIFADYDRIMQVMTNLLSNAAKFSPSGKNVVIRAFEHTAELIRISVADYGSGISDEFQEKLFEKFTQSDSSDARQKGGTGLGLSICKIIIEEHGGSIDFVSHEGKGSTFFFDVQKVKGLAS